MLVNRSATREFSLRKGLKQEDPLSHFLCVLVMEDLNGIMKKVVYEGLFRGFKVAEDVSFIIL